MNKLINGEIPAFQECPFHTKCELKQSNTCHHLGILHQVSYSCAIARAFKLVEEKKSKKINEAK